MPSYAAWTRLTAASAIERAPSIPQVTLIDVGVNRRLIPILFAMELWTRQAKSRTLNATINVATPKTTSHPTPTPAQALKASPPMRCRRSICTWSTSSEDHVCR